MLKVKMYNRKCQKAKNMNEVQNIITEAGEIVDHMQFAGNKIVVYNEDSCEVATIRVIIPQT